LSQRGRRQQNPRHPLFQECAMPKVKLSESEVKDVDQINLDAPFNEAKKKLADAGISLRDRADDAKARAELTKQKGKALAYYAEFDGNNGLKITACVGTKQVDSTLLDMDISEGGDQKKWREALVNLKKLRLVTDADISKWDAKHPDPALVDAKKKQIRELTNQLTVLNMQIKRLQAEAKPKMEALKKLQEEVKKLGN
jgi:hypothetical protein